MTFFPNVSMEATPGLPGWQDMAVSLDPDCPTVLLDAETGERLAHFAELDYSTEVRTPTCQRGTDSGRSGPSSSLRVHKSTYLVLARFDRPVPCR